MTILSSHSRAAGCLLGVGIAVFAAAGMAGQSTQVGVDYARDVQQRTNMPSREGTSTLVMVGSAQSRACPGRGDSSACWNMQPPIEPGTMVGTASTAADTVTTRGADIHSYGRN
jgi:hypothetical protein